MQTKERVFHAIIFELIALAILIPAAAMFSSKDASSLIVVGVGLSLYAVVWNYFYNIWFDKQFGSERASRSLSLRIGHTLGFESGIIFITVPLIAWFLGISLGAALLMEAAFLIFFFFYAIIFNWCYDNIRSRLVAG
ncbi:PACE efflux transporter [Shewanella sp. D64]|uniref:PACE efflux transporter n=1 Tax=unclassified Shewanella TaxID=196818 RepID=UPI0022BA52D3|nr:MULTISPECIES: PACE efflux transporter [unclassified Shewanella]MEC4728248.1 PACE efflux transporter [Shewanella sp. D64]MEC4739298.1 PACE efflux transporter [Shewanella sp. E94]WBJ97042.1 PACE efflux transporter [Shewanella sp. MTB7]